ncbi:MAG: hypothetical protein JO112_03140, partial [Planctomycetes bacterium]|nr:hypothetical protein [Planctomycetota bacterium]
ARRHLTAVLSRQPENARYHALMAAILNEDPKADPHRAADHYRQSLRLQPHQPDCLSDFGLLALRLGQTEEGLAALRQAVELAPNDPEVLGKLVTGLQELDQTEEARQVLIAALFRNSWDGRFRDLWNNFQYDQLRDRQSMARRAQEEPEGEEDRPAVLPFVAPPPSPSPVPQSAKRIRRDKPSPLPPPHIPGAARVPGRKHA